MLTLALLASPLEAVMIPAESLDGRTFAAATARHLKIQAVLLAKLKGTMTHKVVRCEDGCWREDLLTGSRDSCLAFLRRNWNTKLNKGGSELYLMTADNGRFESFVL